jgi:hypothetical protein
MALTRTVLITTPALESEEVGSVWQARPFKLRVEGINVMLSYAELSKLMSDADGEIKDYLGDEHV